MLCSIYAFLVQTQAETRAQTFDPEPLCSLSSSSSFPKLSQWLSSQRSSDYDSWRFSSHRCTRSICLILIFKAFVVVSLSLLVMAVVYSQKVSVVLRHGWCFTVISHLYRHRNSHYLLTFASNPKCCCFVFLWNTREWAPCSCLKLWSRCLDIAMQLNVRNTHSMYTSSFFFFNPSQIIVENSPSLQKPYPPTYDSI